MLIRASEQIATILHFNHMDDLERRQEEALVYVSLSTATLIVCFAVAFALI
jgi:hypothetical protein